jgi:hypothetical protein
MRWLLYKTGLLELAALHLEHLQAREEGVEKVGAWLVVVVQRQSVAVL